MNSLTKVKKLQVAGGFLFMYQVVYIDRVFLTNLLVDYLLLRIVGNVLRCRKRYVRCAAASAFGAAFSCLLMLAGRNMAPVLRSALHGCCAVCMIWIVFSKEKISFRLKALTALYTAAFLFGGILEAVENQHPFGIRSFVLCFVLAGVSEVWITHAADRICRQRPHICPVTIAFRGTVKKLCGYYDTGNLLTDPMNQQPVSVLQTDALSGVISEDTLKLLKNLSAESDGWENTELTCLQPRFIPFAAMEKKGILLAVTLDDLLIHAPKEAVHVSRPVFALTAEPFALGKEYEVLLNSRLL